MHTKVLTLLSYNPIWHSSRHVALHPIKLIQVVLNDLEGKLPVHVCMCNSGNAKLYAHLHSQDGDLAGGLVLPILKLALTLQYKYNFLHVF